MHACVDLATVVGRQIAPRVPTSVALWLARSDADKLREVIEVFVSRVQGQIMLQDERRQPHVVGAGNICKQNGHNTDSLRPTMPEFPDVELYLHALRPRIVGQTLERVRIASPFLLRSVTPDIGSLEGRRVLALRRLGKRIVWALDPDLFVVIHLMIAGRFRWKGSDPLADRGELLGSDPRTNRGGQTPKITLAAFDFPTGTLLLTEAGPKKRASLYVVHGEAALAEHDRGGLDVLSATADDFAARLRLENRTLKRALTDPRLFSGIGNAYSDEILHAARLSPTQLTSNLSEEQTAQLFESVGSVLRMWAARLIEDTGDRFPEKVTAFREGMAVHGRYGQPCPRCGALVQRIQYAANECNYCAPCQTGGRLLADRGLSRLLGKDWPRTLEELEELRRR